jgi:hypothetical protein
MWGRCRLELLLALCALILSSQTRALAQGGSSSASHRFFIDCSASADGDGSSDRPWNSLAAAQAHRFQAGDLIALARGSVCRGNFTPQGSGVEGNPIRLTAYGQGPRPRIEAPVTERQVLLLFNQQYWQIDSLDLSGANTYGVFVSGDKGPLRHIHLKNLYVHDLMGGKMKNKDNGLVVVGPSSRSAIFNDVLIDGVDAAHTNQWAGILIGGGNYAWLPDAPLNRQTTVRNSTVHDVFGDGIILFRDQDGIIKTSAAWQTGMEATQDVGTPNAIWTWTCSDCTVEDNEAYLTDSPGVDGGAYDIDWDNTRNSVERNFAHDTQGYCVAVFAAGYVTSESLVRDNLCIDNGLSPRLAALQGAVYLHTWNDGPIRGLRFEGNTIEWNPPVADAAAIVNDALVQGPPASFTENHIVSTALRMYRSNAQLAPSRNIYTLAGEPVFTLGDRRDVSLAALQAAGIELESSVSRPPAKVLEKAPLRIEASINLAFDADGLLAPVERGQLIVLRSLAGQYGPGRLTVVVHLGNDEDRRRANALGDLEDVYPCALHYDRESTTNFPIGVVRLVSSEGRLLEQWRGFQNAATLGGAVRARLGAPSYAHLQRTEDSEEKQ